MIANYSKLTIKQFLNCKRITESISDPIDKNVRLLAEISGRSVDEIESLPLGKLKDQLKELSNIESLTEAKKLKLKFKLKGQRFEIIWKQQELTAAQYIDVNHFAKDHESIVYNIHNILAAITVKRTWYGKRLKYDGTTHKDTAELFLNHMTIEQAYPIMLFFCKYYEELANNILTYLSGQAVEIMKEVEKTFGPNTGSSQS